MSQFISNKDLTSLSVEINRINEEIDWLDPNILQENAKLALLENRLREIIEELTWKRELRLL